MEKQRRYAIRIGGGILLLFVLVWAIAFTVISLKKDSIKAMAVSQINKQVNGTVTIGDLSPNFFRTFPNISVKLTDVSIRDSLWNEHHFDFLNAERIYIRLQFLSLLSGKPKIGNVIVENASIHLYTDECGYCNLHPTERISFSKGDADIPELTFYNTRLIIENGFLNSHHDIEAKYLDCTLTKKDTMYDVRVDMKTLVHGIGFNLAKGSYLKEKELDGKFHLNYYPENKVSLDHIVVAIDHHPFTVNGDIILHTEPTFYELNINTENINYKKASGLLTESLRQKVDSVDILQPFNIDATIAGVMVYKAKPTVKVIFNVDNVEMTTMLGELSHCSFNGSFVNQVDSLEIPGDPNSKFTFETVSADWSGIHITSSLIEVENLLNPVLKCHLQSQFALAELNALTESATISLIKGNGVLDINYVGSINKQDTVYPAITGSLLLTDADFRYDPRDLYFKIATEASCLKMKML